jgi:amino acid transporter
VGIASWLGYFAAIVIVCSMVAVSFGSYATSLFVGDDAGSAWDNVFTSGIVVAMAAINLVGARFVDRAQSLIVIVLLAVFAIFIAVTIVDIDHDLLASAATQGSRTSSPASRSPSSPISASA